MIEAEIWAWFPLTSVLQLCGSRQENCKDCKTEKDNMLPLEPKPAKAAT